MLSRGETTHYILRVAGAPSKCVRCAPPAAAGCIERLCSLPLRGKVAAPPQVITPFHRKGMAPEATEEQRQLFADFFGPILRASPSSFLRKEPALRDLLLCHQYPQDVEQKRKMTS